MQRNLQGGWAQRIVVFVMFVLVCAPVVARWACQPPGTAGRSGDAEAERESQSRCSR